MSLQNVYIKETNVAFWRPSADGAPEMLGEMSGCLCSAEGWASDGSGRDLACIVYLTWCLSNFTYELGRSKEFVSVKL